MPVRYSYMPLIGVHEMHGQMHPNQGLVTGLLAHDPFNIGLPYDHPMITYTPLVACNFPIKTLVARQRPTNASAKVYVHYLT